MSDKKEEEAALPEDPEVTELKKKLGDKRYESLAEDVAGLNVKFKTRRKKVQEKLLQPPTPTKEELNQLEQEVEENLKTKSTQNNCFTSISPFVMGDIALSLCLEEILRQ